MGGFFSSSNEKKAEPKKEQQRFVSTMQVKSKITNEMSEQDRMILDLKKVQDSLNKRLKQYEADIQNCKNKSKKYLKEDNKKKAKYEIEKKVLFEKYMDNILNQDLVITKTIRQVQDKYDQLESTKVLQKANLLMQDLNKAIDVDGIQDAMGNLQELELNNQRFDELYAQYVGPESQEAQNQLQQMEAEIFKSELQNHEIATQKPIIKQPQINLSENQNNDNIKQKKEIVENKDEIDDQLAMLA